MSTCVACKREFEGGSLQCPECQQKPRGGMVAAKRPKSPHDSGWESDYHAHLAALKKAGAIRDYRWKDFRVRLVKQDGERDRYYSPEALVWALDGAIEVHEVKGRKRNEGMMRFDLARQQWPCFRWRMLAKERGRWVQIRGAAA